ncbi:MAG: hypothetical protein KA712_21535 [Myxococcales bacterium]|nr:hypothetical protein [Myxococcales bacterium]
MRSLALALSCGLSLCALSSLSLAAPAPAVQPNGRLQFTAGLGLGHDEDPERSGLGVNLEMAYGLGSGTEIGVRTGVRSPDGRALGADAFGRLFDFETFGTAGQTFANPELRLRKAVLPVLALEARLYVPFDSPFGFMLAAPVWFSGGRSVRLNTGVYVPILFSEPTRSWVSLPAHLWFHAGGGWYLGVLGGARLDTQAGDWAIPLGVGFDRTLSTVADLLLSFVLPDVTRDDAANTFGAGLALRIRI